MILIWMCGMCVCVCVILYTQIKLGAQFKYVSHHQYCARYRVQTLQSYKNVNQTAHPPPPNPYPQPPSNLFGYSSNKCTLCIKYIIVVDPIKWMGDIHFRQKWIKTRMRNSFHQAFHSISIVMLFHPFNSTGFQRKRDDIAMPN